MSYPDRNLHPSNDRTGETVCLRPCDGVTGNDRRIVDRIHRDEICIVRARWRAGFPASQMLTIAMSVPLKSGLGVYCKGSVRIQQRALRLQHPISGSISCKHRRIGIGMRGIG